MATDTATPEQMAAISRAADARAAQLRRIVYELEDTLAYHDGAIEDAAAVIRQLLEEIEG